MATQYIPDDLAELVKKEAVKATKIAGRPVTKAEVVKLLISKGLKETTAEQWKQLLAE